MTSVLDQGQLVADYAWMNRAIELARRAPPGDLPFGCVIVDPQGREAAWALGTGNLDPLSHSEMVAIHMAAGQRTEPEWLHGYTLYSTHEPCSMCCGGINHAKISRVVWGSHRADLQRLFSLKPRSAYDMLQDTRHPPVCCGGVLGYECVALFDGIEKWDALPSR